ncbi:hypothetical protein, partial [Pseudarthrobacter sp. MDT1-22]
SLQASGERWGVAAICIGVGQGLAVVLENVTAAPPDGSRSNATRCPVGTLQPGICASLTSLEIVGLLVGRFTT